MATTLSPESGSVPRRQLEVLGLSARRANTEELRNEVIALLGDMLQSSPMRLSDIGEALGIPISADGDQALLHGVNLRRTLFSNTYRHIKPPRIPRVVETVTSKKPFTINEQISENSPVFPRVEQLFELLGQLSLSIDEASITQDGEDPRHYKVVNVPSIGKSFVISNALDCPVYVVAGVVSTRQLRSLGPDHLQHLSKFGHVMKLEETGAIVWKLRLIPLLLSTNQKDNVTSSDPKIVRGSTAFIEICRLVQAMKFKNVRAYKEYAKTTKHLPQNPDITHRSEGWTDWCDFLGKEKPLNLTLKELEAEVRFEGITTEEQYHVVQRQKYPYRWPACPERCKRYQNDWKGFPALCGVERGESHRKQFLPFPEFLAQVRKSGVRTAREYWIEQRNHKNDWPSDPYDTYDEWTTWYEVLGTRHAGIPGGKGGSRSIRDNRKRSKTPTLDIPDLESPATDSQTA